jgi:hypothetical protein
MDPKKIAGAVGICLAIWHTIRAARARRRNRLGLCAKCGADFGFSPIQITGSYQTYCYCQRCGRTVRLVDRIFLGLFCIIALLLVGGIVIMKFTG